MTRSLLFYLIAFGVLSSCIGYGQSNVVQMEGRKLGTVYPFSNTATSSSMLTPEQKALLKVKRGQQNFKDRTMLEEVNPNALPHGVDPALQLPTFTPPAPPIPPRLNIEGMAEATSYASVPDVNGDVSADYYFQAVNPGYYRIFDTETGEPLSDITPTYNFWQGLNFLSAGDPVVLYDQDADRWLFMEFNADYWNVLLLAISSTGDPTGAWTAYEFSTFAFPDYPKIALWQDSYVITSAEAYQPNIPIYFLNRDELLNEEATFGVQGLLEITKFQVTEAFQAAAPIDWDGNIPVDANSGPLALQMYDDSWGAGGPDRLELWEFVVDWEEPLNTGLVQSHQIITTPFESTVCSYNILNCIPQPSGDVVAALQHVIMNRPSYRRFATHESIVCTHTVDVDGNNKAGVRWYELRKTTTQDWHVYQEGTISPDNDHRFMPTIAIDSKGNIALAYAVTGEQTELSLRYTARKANDPLGQMTYDEYEVATGLSNQPNGRWGDYFSLSVDPVQQTEFWLTGEYMQANEEWGTKITAFSIHRDSIDIGPLSLLTPVSDTSLTSTETITADFYNFGDATQNHFWLGYELEDGTVVIDTINTPLVASNSYTHTFSQAADLSSIGEHPIKLFSGVVNDAVVLNDTTSRNIQHYPRFDVKIRNNSDLLPLTCDNNNTLELVIENNGFITLTSATVDVNVNGSFFTSIPWTGNLAYLEYETINIPLSNLAYGINTVDVNVYAPNGMPDEIVDNNVRSFSTTYLEYPEICTFTLITDPYPDEVSWQLTTSDGSDIVYEGGNYSGNIPITIQEEWCLHPDSCYIFTIFDSASDGMSGSSPGTYSIVNSSGVTIANLVDIHYREKEINEFCSKFECNVEAYIGTTPSQPVLGGNTGSINVEATAGISPFQYSIDGGMTYQSNVYFNDLPGDIYDVVVLDANGCEAHYKVEVIGCDIQVVVDVTHVSAPGASDGSIVVNASMGIPPFSHSIDGGIYYYYDNVFDNLAEGTYEVVVIDSIFCTSFTQTVEISSSVETDNQSYEATINISPNPTDGLLDISVKGIDDVSVIELTVFDNAGHPVERGRLTKYNDYLRAKVPLYHLPSGTYFVQFHHKKLGKQMAKVIKQ